MLDLIFSCEKNLWFKPQTSCHRHPRATQSPGHTRSLPRVSEHASKNNPDTSEDARKILQTGILHQMCFSFNNRTCLTTGYWFWLITTSPDNPPDSEGAWNEDLKNNPTKRDSGPKVNLLCVTESKHAQTRTLHSDVMDGENHWWPSWNQRMENKSQQQP